MTDAEKVERAIRGEYVGPVQTLAPLLVAEIRRLTRERDAWSDEAVKMLRQRNVLLGWARERAGLAHVHDVMIAAGLAAAAGEEGISEPGWLDRGLKAIKEDSKTWPAWMKRDAAPADDPETLDCPCSARRRATRRARMATGRAERL